MQDEVFYPITSPTPQIRSPISYQLHPTQEPHLSLQKEPSAESGSPVTPEVALLPLSGPV